VRDLTESTSDLVAENDRLRAENDELRADIRAKDDKLREFQGRLLTTIRLLGAHPEG
jgi:hypothetical protein